MIGLAVALAAGVTFFGASPAAAEDLATTSPDAARELAERYAPIMMLKAQEEPCDRDGEPYGPTSVGIVLDNPEVLLRQLGPSDPVVKVGPTASDLFGLGEGFFLEFPGSALEPGCIYETDFRRYSKDLPPVVYAHIVQQADRPDELALQYWFYWYYNDWNNKHESDWEGIQILFEASSIEEALATEPVSVGYAQHTGGERADWNASKLEREGTHPVVYSSAGSHASYFSSALYMGRSGSEGFGCDNTDGPSDRYEPEVVVLPDRVDDPDDPLAWLTFEGRWGERQRGPFNGPTGPAAKDRWLEPLEWHDELRSTSVIIPGGDDQASVVISTFCGVVEWGSGQLIAFSTTPIRLLVSLLAAVFVANLLIKRTDWALVPAAPLIARRRAGQILRAAVHVYRRSFGSFARFGVIYLPTAVLAGLIAALVRWLPVIGDLIGLTGRAGGVRLVFALLVGGIPHLMALITVNAMVAAFMETQTSGAARTAGASVRLVWERRRSLFGGLLRATVVVTVLLVTVIGIPWGIRQAVRYQLMPQAVILEGLDGRDALARSTELVRGRWWHTGLMVTLFHLLSATSGMALGLVLLVAFTSLPLWVFSVAVALVGALIVPLTSAAQTLLYADAVAEKQEVAAEKLTV